MLVSHLPSGLKPSLEMQTYHLMTTHFCGSMVFQFYIFLNSISFFRLFNPTLCENVICFSLIFFSLQYESSEMEKGSNASDAIRANFSKAVLSFAPGQF